LRHYAQATIRTITGPPPDHHQIVTERIPVIAVINLKDYVRKRAV